MSYLAEFGKDPSARLDYVVDWSVWLGVDTIVASTWTISVGLLANGGTSEENPPTLVADTPTFTATVCTIWLSGGTDLQEYKVTNRITTAGGRIDDRTLCIKVYEH